MTFQQRGQMLKAVAKYLLEHKASLYEISAQTGATKADSWVDIEGGIATLFSFAGLANRELPDDTIWPEDDDPAIETRPIYCSPYFNFPPWCGITYQRI